MIRPWINLLLRCKTLDHFRSVLTHFSQHTWTLQQRSIISGIYTPHVVKLLGGAEEKGRVLEELAMLCWGNRGTH